jgi:peptidoglycan/xylan/chitin deacetylase (PgdA/CDA1 family)
MNTAKAWLKAGIRRGTRWVPHKPGPTILMYHRIGAETFDPWGLVVEPDRLAAQFEWLARNRTMLQLTDFARLHQERQLPPDAVSLTFDDGYASVLDAVPLLQKHAIHATVFLPVEIIEQGRSFWWDELAQMIIDWSSETLQLDGTYLSVPPAQEHEENWPPDTPPRTPRQKLFQSLWSRLHAMRPAVLGAAMAQLREQAPPTEPNAMDRPLTPEEVRAVSSDTISFGSHGLTHPSLPALSDDEKLHEIADSRARCAALTGTAPATFAYPFGEMDNASVLGVKQAGYACACATGDRFVRSQSDNFALPRLRVGDWEVSRLRDMLGG